MLSASARTLLIRPSTGAASRRLLATSSKATPAKSAPLAVAVDAHHSHGDHEAPVSSPSHGERAWCEVYGVDYAKMVQQAHDESPLALNTPPAASAHATPSHEQPPKDIWSVVFGTHA